MSGTKTSFLSAFLLISSLVLLTVIVTISISSLSWPFGSGGGITLLRNPTSVAPRSAGAINFTAVFREVNPQFGITQPNSNISIPIDKLRVTVSAGNPLHTILVNYTDTKGKLAVILPPNQYTLTASDPRFNVSITAQVVGGETTHVDLIVNNTFYPTIFYDIFDKDSAGLIGNWQSIYVRIQSNQTIANASQTVFVWTVRGNLGEILPLSCGICPVIPVFFRLDNASTTVISESINKGILSMQLYPKSFLNSSNILSLSLSTYFPRVTVSIGNAT